MADFVRRIKVEGLFSRASLAVDLVEDVNIFYGVNGSGKTTLLHILANMLNQSFDRFAYLDFSGITLQTGLGHTIELTRERKKDDYRIIVRHNGRVAGDFLISEVQQKAGHVGHSLCQPLQQFDIAASYFPAFRTMIEPPDDRREEGRYMRYLIQESAPYTYTRGRYSQFVPTVNYPSLSDVEEGVANQYKNAALALAEESRTLFADAFVKAIGLGAGQETPERPGVLDDLSQLLREAQMIDDPGHVFARLRSALATALSQGQLQSVSIPILHALVQQAIEAQHRCYRTIEQYIKSVNDFLEGKTLTSTRSGDRWKVFIKFDNGDETSLRALSSGERQIVTMLYAAVQQNPEDKVVLIDEPELSLHMVWQHRVIQSMREQLGSKQIVVCTHSPGIAKGFEDRLQQLTLL